MSDKKVEIIEIDLNVNISEEIKNKVDSLNSDIIIYTKGLIEKIGLRPQKLGKKRRAKKEREERAAKALEYLVKAYENGNSWTKGQDLCLTVGIEPNSKNLNTLSRQLRSHLKKEDKWTLVSTRKRKCSVYRIERFGS